MQLGPRPTRCRAIFYSDRNLSVRPSELEQSRLVWPARDAKLRRPVVPILGGFHNEKTRTHRLHARSSGGRPEPGFSADTCAHTELQGGKMLWPCQGRQERLRINRQQLVWRQFEGQRQSEGLDLRPGRLL